MLKNYEMSAKAHLEAFAAKVKMSANALLETFAAKVKMTANALLPPIKRFCVESKST